MDELLELGDFVIRNSWQRWFKSVQVGNTESFLTVYQPFVRTVRCIPTCFDSTPPTSYISTNILSPNLQQNNIQPNRQATNYQPTINPTNLLMQPTNHPTNQSTNQSLSRQTATNQLTNQLSIHAIFSPLHPSFY